MNLQEPAAPERESPTTDGLAVATLPGSPVPAETEAVRPRVSPPPTGRVSRVNEMTSADFYQDVAPFHRFTEVADPRHYVPVPGDWTVVMTDVEGSTKAIAEHRYRDVNFLGGASIAAVLNALDRRRLPYVFGGDGATVLIPSRDVGRVRPALVALQRVARSSFALELRAGLVPIKDLLERGARVHVAKFRLSPDATLAMVRGGGLSLAERWIKDPTPRNPYRIGAGDGRGAARPPADFDGLSCRWSPIAARQGEMISLLVLATGDPESWPGTYRRVLQGIEAVLGESPDSHPVTEAKLDSRLALRNLRAEIAIRRHQSPPQRLRHLAGAIVGAVNTFVGYQRGWTFSFFDPARYVRTLVANSDFRKFDDMLRMIRDCSREQRAAIVALLDGMRAEGKLAYGLHRSGHAVMTCLVYGMTDHIHFIDGADGGYAFAATQLKAQLARAAAPRHARYDRGACR